MDIMIIAIDGPAGAGKSTISKRVARQLNFQYIDTGAMYRGVTLKCLRLGLQPDQVSQKLIDLKTEIQLDGEKIFLDGEDVSQEIRSIEVSQSVSAYSAIPEVRLFLVDLQRAMAINQNILVDGRDIGTYVFPNAELKIFLTADVEVRAKRRFLEMQEKGNAVSFEEIVSNIETRDRIDSQREMAPLKKADDAIEVDTSSMKIEEVVEHILFLVTAKQGKGINH
ncbi:(d)CMP kinase [Gottschalkiaceae bacterium SANA]|nr:(d)CMP kinase [Gottschalkiaceae bacterium SANA]